MKIISDLKKYLSEVRTEVRKVSWPTKGRTIKDSTIVVMVSLITAVFLGGIDYLLTYFIEKFILK
ncbi:MAG: preprotein translocase subunit SecE [Minisyncoccia bacterium]